MCSMKVASRPARLVLLGPPGAGKGTQAKILADYLRLYHIASGDLFRYHQKEGTPLGLKAMEYMSQGLLVPDEITTVMVLERVLGPQGHKRYLLDGFPRNLVQAQGLDEALLEQGQNVDKVVLLKVPEKELLARLSGRLVCRQCQATYHRETAPPKTPDKCDLCGGELYQREDDRVDAVMVRIQVYKEETEPLVEYYNGKEKLLGVEGVGTVAEVSQRLLGSLW